MCYFCLMDPFGAYLSFLVLMFMVLGCLGWDDDLVDVCGVVVLYWGAGLGVSRSMLLYCLLMAFMQALSAPSSSTPISEVFSLGLSD